MVHIPTLIFYKRLLLFLLLTTLPVPSVEEEHNLAVSSDGSITDSGYGSAYNRGSSNNVSDKSPPGVNTYASLALKNVNAEDFTLAKKFLSKARFQEPFNYRHWHDLAVLFLRSGQTIDASYHFQKALQLITLALNDNVDKTTHAELSKDKTHIVNVYEHMQKTIKLSTDKIIEECDILLNNLKYVKAIECLKTVYQMKDIFVKSNKKSFQKSILNRIRYALFNTGYAEEALDICKEVSDIEGHEIICDQDEYYMVTLRAHVCFIKYIKNGGSFPLLKYTNNPCIVFSNNYAKGNGLVAPRKHDLFFKCIMLAAGNFLSDAIKCGERLLNFSQNIHNKNAKVIEREKSLMPVYDVVRAWHVRQAMDRNAQNLFGNYQHPSFFLLGKVFVLNRKKRAYRRYQAKKVLTRLELGIPLTFVDAIDKEEIQHQLEENNNNVGTSLLNVLKRYNLSNTFKIAPNELKTAKPTLGEIGCAMSHVYLWKKLLQSKSPFAIVFEDDAIIKGNLERYEREVGRFLSREIHFLSVNSDLPQKLKDWDYLHLGACKKTPLENYILPPFLSQSDFQYCTHAYVVSRRGATKLLNLVSKYNVIPIDNFLTWAWGKPHETAREKIVMYSNPHDYMTQDEQINSFVLGNRLVPFTQFNVKDGSPHGGTSDVSRGHQ